MGQFRFRADAAQSAFRSGLGCGVSERGPASGDHRDGRRADHVDLLDLGTAFYRSGVDVTALAAGVVTLLTISGRVCIPA